VHADISPSNLIDAVRDNPGANLYVHPECGCTTSALWLAESGELPAGRTHILSTGGMLDAARAETRSQVLVATEIGMLHQLRKANPTTEFRAVNPQAKCPFMNMITPINLEACLGDPATTAHFEVDVEAGVAAKARQAVEKMIAIGNPGSGE
ncbi:MAG: quinolinate synthase NadA, partial [Pseudomonadota bacterium]|nr:quinolinate synthase NadA [Pseudomonadota bacterium]